MTRTLTEQLSSSLTIEPLRLAVTLAYPSGSSYRLHVEENGDLCIGDVAGSLLANATGRILIGLDVDGGHDSVHHDARGLDGGAAEVLKRGIEALTASLKAVESIGAVS
jgi:hypothetical protein